METTSHCLDWGDEDTSWFERYCGNDSLPAPIVTASPRVQVVFVSDILVTDRGFLLQYNVAGE